METPLFLFFFDHVLKRGAVNISTWARTTSIFQVDSWDVADGRLQGDDDRLGRVARGR